MQPKYKRVLLRLNGESLVNGKEHGVGFDTALKIRTLIKACVDLGVQAGIIVDGSGFWRGRSSGEIDRTRVDHMGMLTTVTNALSVADALEQLGMSVQVRTAITMQQVTESYIRSRAARYLEKGRVVVFDCGTGNPFFSTDTATSLHTTEIDADTIMKATLADGVYDNDPKLNEAAVKFGSLSSMDVLNKGLYVMDSTAATLCKNNDIPVLVFSIVDPENILRVVYGKPIGTLVKQLILQKQK